MADKVTFRGAFIRYFDGRHEEGGCFVRVHFTAELTQPVMDAMGWADPGPSTKSAKMNGELIGTHLVLMPTDKKLREFETQLDINEVSGFEVVTVTEKESTRRELRFMVRSPSVDAAALLDHYTRKVGDFPAALVISYSVQEVLDTKADTGPATK